MPQVFRYFYFAAEDIVNSIVIPANSFTNDDGTQVSQFVVTGITGYANLYINGVMQEGSLYGMNPDALTLFLQENDSIGKGTPIIVEALLFSSQLVAS